MSRDHDHFHLFDGLRALAATSVFALHAWIILNPVSLSNPEGLVSAINLVGIEGVRDLGSFFINLGHFGVALFYVISAFLLYRPFYKARIKGDPRPNTRSYFIRRVVRIIPAYWVALTIIGLLDHPPGLFTWRGFLDIYCMTFIYRDGSFMFNQILPAWTICVEATFYIFLPLWSVLIARIARRSGHPFRIELVGLALLALFSMAWKIVVLKDLHSIDFAQRDMVILPASLDVFAAGMALAVLSVRHEAAIRSGELPRVLRSGALWWTLAFVGYCLLCFLIDPRGPFPGTNPNLGSFPNDFQTKVFLVSTLKIPICVAVAMPAIFGIVGGGGPVRAFLGSRPVQWIGMVSYGLYLWHIFVLQHLAQGGPFGLSPLLPNTQLKVFPFASALGYAITLMIAALSWYLIERPSLHRGRRWARRIERKEPKPLVAS